MPEYGFTLTEHDPERPWIVVGQEQRIVWLDDEARFFEWAAEQWPGPRWTAELDPWQLSPEWPGSERSSKSATQQSAPGRRRLVDQPMLARHGSELAIVPPMIFGAVIVLFALIRELRR